MTDELHGGDAGTGLRTGRGVDDPRRADLADELREVLEGLAGPEKRIPSKYHYDARGSRLFEDITELDEYYLTRTERALLEAWMPPLVEVLRPATLVELGAGSAEKSRIILDAMVESGCAGAYVPVDVSAAFLAETAETLRTEYPGLEVVPEVADITGPLRLPAGLPHPRWIAFLGSTLGNFDEAEAVALLARIAERLGDGDRFLLGVDLRPGPRKSVERVEAAYNDARGVTAEFSRNILAVLNDTFGSDFDPGAFEHRSSYNPEKGRIETSLESTREQTIRFPGGQAVEVTQGERIRTEISSKYDRPTVEGLFAAAGLAVDRWLQDEEGLYALVLSGPAG
jgi:L-histidine N-alpha-methyltransferase